MNTPRAIAKAVARGQPRARPLFIPLLFSVAAKLEAVPLQTFLADPTKLANTITSVYQHLRPDGVVAYFDETLAAEALGCRLTWDSTGPVVASTLDALPAMNQTALETAGRIPVALEVVRRLHTMLLRDEPALIVGLNGPLHLGRLTLGDEFLDRLAGSDDDGVMMLEQLAATTLHLARAFCQAGADLIIVTEQSVPDAVLEEWQWEVEAIWNVIRFHEALPVALFTPGPAPSVPLDGSPVVCRRSEEVPTDALPTDPFGIALMPGNPLPATVEQICASPHCVLVTTAGEIPYETDIKTVEHEFRRIRTVLNSTEA